MRAGPMGHFSAFIFIRTLLSLEKRHEKLLDDMALSPETIGLGLPLFFSSTSPSDKKAESIE